MASTYTVTVDIKEDGKRLPSFPVTKSVTPTESGGRQQFSRPDDSGTYTELPLGELAGVSVLFVQADQAVTLRFNDQSDGGVPLAANGLLLLVDGAIPSGAASKASLENASGSAAVVTTVSGGS